MMSLIRIRIRRTTLGKATCSLRACQFGMVVTFEIVNFEFLIAQQTSSQFSASTEPAAIVCGKANLHEFMYQINKGELNDLKMLNSITVWLPGERVGEHRTMRATESTAERS